MTAHKLQTYHIISHLLCHDFTQVTFFGIEKVKRLYSQRKQNAVINDLKERGGKIFQIPFMH